MVQVIIQAGELGIPDTIQLIVPDLTDNRTPTGRRCRRGGNSLYRHGRVCLPYPAAKPSSSIIMRNTVIEPGPWAALSYATLYILADGDGVTHNRQIPLCNS